ncbi:MAG: hypothetical protein ACTHM1_09400 [Solirubrobacteraceae bacterium]
MRYFASGLIAGGAGVTLTLLLTATAVHWQSYTAFGILNVLLLFGCLYFLRSAVRWMGFPVPWWLIVVTVGFLANEIWHGVISHPEHLVRAFAGEWWGLVVRAVVTTFLGAGFRYVVEMEMDDLQYGLDHGRGVKQGAWPSETRAKGGRPSPGKRCDSKGGA